MARKPRGDEEEEVGRGVSWMMVVWILVCVADFVGDVVMVLWVWDWEMDGEVWPKEEVRDVLSSLKHLLSGSSWSSREKMERSSPFHWSPNS
jgi:hypothetical protein